MLYYRVASFLSNDDGGLFASCVVGFSIFATYYGW